MLINGFFKTYHKPLDGYMIGLLEGVIVRIQADRCWIFVSGLGYIVSVGHRLASQLSVQHSISLWIETVVYDGQSHLFGFKTQQEQSWFQFLTAVSGVGGRLAVAILSNLDPDALATSISENQLDSLRSIDGVGPKLANRLMTELKDKAQSWVKTRALSVGTAEGFTGVHQDVILALMALGYRKSDAESAVLRVLSEFKPDTVAQMITHCLPLLSPS
jgi:Holliday junction DNA helicase RuvA